MPEAANSEEALTVQLSQGLEALGQNAAKVPVQAYLDYIRLLLKWNQSYNLSGIKTADKMLSYHVLDSLSVLPYLQGQDCLDVGSGAGLPGFILALAEPERNWTLLDSNNKKTRFLKQLVLELKPGNVEVVHARVEDYRPEIGFSTVISRAMSAFSSLRQSTSHLVREGGQLIAMKGEVPFDERRLLEAVSAPTRIQTLQVPGVDSERNLVIQSKLTV